MKKAGYALFGILFIIGGRLTAQETDIKSSILKIRKQYGIIVNKEIDGLSYNFV